MHLFIIISIRCFVIIISISRVLYLWDQLFIDVYTHHIITHGPVISTDWSNNVYAF